MSVVVFQIDVDQFPGRAVSFMEATAPEMFHTLEDVCILFWGSISAYVQRTIDGLKPKKSPNWTGKSSSILKK